jgi:hypothetical protein
MLISKAIETLTWMTEHFKQVNQNDESFIEPSKELQKAFQLLEDLKEIENHHILISLNLLPSYARGVITKDDIEMMIQDTLRMRTQ